MRLDPNHESPDVIDRRGQRMAGMGGGGLVGLFFLLARSRLGWVGAALIVGGIVAFNYFAGGGSQSALRSQDPQGQQQAGGEGVAFVSGVLDDVQQTWGSIFAAAHKEYPHAKLVLFTDETATGCGSGSATTGPFYCPADRQVYIDLGFFAELESRFAAPGDFARAYVIAHEVGHHVQKILGTSDRVEGSRDSEGANGSSVRLELQADCYAGVWAHSGNQRQILEAGDMEEGLAAAAAVGDDRLQKQAQGRVSPESWTHGSSEQRTRWFRRGFDSGDPDQCDTFSARAL